MKKSTLVIAALLSVLFALSAAQALAATNFFQGFETDNSGWNILGGQYDAVRVASGTNGVTSRTGSFHAEAQGPYGLDCCGGSAFTRWGGYESSFPATGYTTKVDIYLDVATSAANDTRFDWDSAINDASGAFRRDFLFNGGFYNDSDSTGTGPRFVFTASNNAGRGSSFPKNPGRSPFTISTTGWYTFQHRFYDSGGGVLAVDLSILDSTGTPLKTWTLSDPTDLIGTTVGGHRYGWFASQEFSFLAFDNSQLITLIGPPTSKDQCKKDGWQAFNNPTFKNQGQCVSYVEQHN